MKRNIFFCFVLLICLKQAKGLKLKIVHMKLPEIKNEFNMTSHLNVSHIKKVCVHRDTICKVNNSKVCTMRRVNETFEYKDFENSCYLFLSNMCDYPGIEFSIVEGINCEAHLKSRRHYQLSGVKQEDVAISPNDTSWADGNTTKPALREFSFSTLYEMDTAYDRHICPPSCPHVYEPVCVNANRGFGKFLKFYQFVNHCEADKYYCQHWEEFQPPPDREEESVSASPLGWSYCGASRYLQFSLLAQTTSSMGHYGWLDGDFSYAHILEPKERRPGFG